MSLDRVCWAIPRLLSNNQVGLLPYKGEINKPTDIPSCIHILDPFTTDTVQQHLKYPQDFEQLPSHWFDITYRKATKDIFILDFLGDVHRISMDSLKWEKIAKGYALGPIGSRPYHRKSRVFIKNNKCCIIAAVLKYGTDDLHTLCYKIWEINEATTEFDEISCSESFTRLPYPWENAPVLLNKSDDVVLIREDAKCMQLLKFCRSNGSIQNIKLNDTITLNKHDFNAKYGHVVLRDDIIILFDKIVGYNKPWINIVDIKKGSIIKSLILPSELFIHRVDATLMENIAKEELLVHGYCKDNTYTLPLAIAHLITSNYYANESILFIMNGEEIIRYAVCDMIDIFARESNLIDDDKRYLKFTNAKML